MKCTRGGCKNWAIRGGSVCKNHGGNAPQVKRAAQIRLLEAKAQKLAQKLLPDTVEVHPDPIRRVLELAAEADAFRASVRELVNGLESLSVESYQQGQQVAAEILVYERALERAARAYLDICKLNLEERLVRIQEDVALAMLKALDRALAEAGLSAELVSQVKGSTAKHLRAVS